MTAPDLTDMAADLLAAREPMRCPCGAPCSHSHGLCDGCEAWAETLEVAQEADPEGWTVLRDLFLEATGRR